MDNHSSKKGWIDRHPLLLILLGVVVLIFIFAAIGTSDGSTPPPSTTSTAPAEQTSSVTNSICSSPTLASDAKKIDYKQLEKDPGNFDGRVAAFTGKILQIEQSGNDGFMRLSVTNEGYGIWSSNDVLYITYHQGTAAVEGDIVTVTGTLTGSDSYTSVANFQITIPSMDACTITEASAPKSAAPAQTMKKTTPLRTPIAAPAPASAASQSAQPSQPPTYTTPSGAVVTPQGSVISSPAMWHTAYTFSGTTKTKTPTFSLQGQQQRISYTCSISDTSNTAGSDFYGLIHGATSYEGDSFAIGVSCPGSSSTYEYSLPPGQYYLDLDGYNASFRVTVEDYY